MIKKEVGLKLFLGIFLLVILSSGVLAVETGTCDIVAQDECSNDDTTGYILMGLSSETNAHGEIAKKTEIISCVGTATPCSGLSQTSCKSQAGCFWFSLGIFGTCIEAAENECEDFLTESKCLSRPGCSVEGEVGYTSSVDYPYVLCCNFGEGDTTCDGANKIIGLSALTNAHAEGKTGTSYTNNVCYENIQCELSTSCDADENEILSLTSTTNAHIGGAEDYPNKVCCTKESMERTICKVSSVNWTDSEGDVISVAFKSEEVNMQILGTSCSEKSVSLQVYEDKVVDSEVGSLITKIFEASSRIAEPLEIEREIESEYYFTAKVENLDEIKSGNLIINDDNYCVLENLNVCEDYDNKRECEEDFCDVAEDEINGMQGDKDFCDTYTCGCSWNDEENICKASYSQPDPEDVICGNGKVETGEECDLGQRNGAELSGCDKNCNIVCNLCLDKFPNEMVPEGMSLCQEDGRVVLDNYCPFCIGKEEVNCGVTVNCDKDGICEMGESCDCEDCKDGDQDTCSNGLVCSKEADNACCEQEQEKDGICNIYCSYYDPDCGGKICGDGICDEEESCSSCAGDCGSCGDDTYCGDGICNGNEACGTCEKDCGECEGGECGNGIKEYGEQCDDGNKINDDACSNVCKINEFEEGPCPEGTTLCKDGTCSINCRSSDGGYPDCNYNDICESGEGCNCPDCDGKQDTCKNNLLCSSFEVLCCDFVGNGVCYQPCASVDPDCMIEPEIDPFKCIITQEETNSCDEEPVGEKIVIWTGEWIGEETSGEEYDKCIAGGESKISCAAKLQLPFFDYIEFIIAIVIIAIIYTAVIYNKKNKKKKRKNKK